MKFLFATIGLGLGLVLARVLAPFIGDVVCFFVGFACVVGLEVGTRIANRGADPEVKAFMRPSPFTYRCTMGLVSGVLPIVVVIADLDVPGPAVIFWVSFAIGQWLTPVGIAAVYSLALVYFGAFLGGQFNRLMTRGYMTLDEVFQ